MNFKLRENFFPGHLFADAMKFISPDKWWRIMLQKQLKRKILSPGFCEFMIGLHLYPVSSGSKEFLASLAWFGARNAIGWAWKKPKKLVKVYRHLWKLDSV